MLTHNKTKKKKRKRKQILQNGEIVENSVRRVYVLTVEDKQQKSELLLNNQHNLQLMCLYVCMYEYCNIRDGTRITNAYTKKKMLMSERNSEFLSV